MEFHICFSILVRFCLSFALCFCCFIERASSQSIRAFNVYCNAYPGEGGKLNPYVSVNKIFINELLKEHISEAAWGVKVLITEIEGAEATRKNMLEAWDRFAATVQPKDTVFVHFSGHGAIVGRNGGPQILQMCDEELVNRDEWAKSIAGLACRLRILTTDCCSSFIPVEVAEGDDEVRPWDSLYHLFMLHEGFVDITAASPGEFAWYTERGGYLTVNLHSDMQRYQSWETVFAETKKRVIVETGEQVGEVQTPVAHSLGRPLGNVQRPQSVSFVIPDSDRRLLKRSELERLGLQHLYLARNEIVARHGYDFSTPLLQKYFASQTWYRKQPGKKNYQLNDIEASNAELIQKIEVEKGGPFIKYIDPNRTQQYQDIFPHSSTHPLPRTAVESLSRPQLSIARNEIFARHGFPFKSQKLASYFALNPNYHSRSGATSPRFTAIEAQNLWLIKKVERIRGGPYKW